jgi:hypothetical protein
VAVFKPPPLAPTLYSSDRTEQKHTKKIGKYREIKDCTVDIYRHTGRIFREWALKNGSDGRLIPPDVLSRRTFCPSGRFVPVCYVSGRFVWAPFDALIFCSQLSKSQYHMSFPLVFRLFCKKN